MPLLGDQSFFEGKSIQELAQSQGVGPVKDISVFAGGIPDDEDVDEMLDEIYRARLATCESLGPEGASRE
jgi:hypothetical protein